MSRRRRLPRSAGTATPLDIIWRAFRPPSPAAIASDFAAIDRGEGRTLACMFRASYGIYPRRFRRKMLDLTPEGLTLRPFWSSPSRTRFLIEEQIVSAHQRVSGIAGDARVLAASQPQGGPLDYAGFDIIQCETTRGQLELAVPRPDVPLVLHFLHRTAARR